MQIDLTESEYRTLLSSLAESSDKRLLPSDVRRRYSRLRDNLRVRWERAADEAQQIPEPK